MTRGARLSLGIDAIVFAVTWCCNASADGTSPQEQKAVAEALFEQGRALVEQGHFVEACPKLAESARLDPGIGTLLWLGDCYENAGLTASAWGSFKEAGAAAAARHDERERIARARAAELEPKLSRLNIVVPADAVTPGMKVERDGLIVGDAEWGVALPVDPGVHTLAVTSPGRQRFSVTIRISPSEAVLPVAIPPLLPESGRTPLPTATGANHATTLPNSSRDRGSVGDGERVAGVALAGLGVSAIVVGTVFSLGAKARYDDSNRGGHCLPDSECDSTGRADRHQASTLALVATIAMSAGAATAAAGAVLYFAAPKTPRLAIALAPLPRGSAVRLTVPW